MRQDLLQPWEMQDLLQPWEMRISTIYEPPSCSQDGADEASDGCDWDQDKMVEHAQRLAPPPPGTHVWGPPRGPGWTTVSRYHGRRGHGASHLDVHFIGGQDEWRRLDAQKPEAREGKSVEGPYTVDGGRQRSLGPPRPVTIDRLTYPRYARTIRFVYESGSGAAGDRRASHASTMSILLLP
eukprot:2386548-Prymnesium_polylepis.1